MSDCIFCKLVSGEIPTDKVMETKTLIAIKDIKPSAPHHYLFIPKKHYATANDITTGDTIMTDIYEAARELAKKLGIAESGYRIVTNVNKDGGQVVFHLHVHLLGGHKMGRLG